MGILADLAPFRLFSCCRSLSRRPRKGIPEIEVSAILSLYQLGELRAFANARVEVGRQLYDLRTPNAHHGRRIPARSEISN